MAETYKKIGDKLEVTVTNVREVSELELLEQKQRLEQNKKRAEEDVARTQVQIDEIDAKLVVVNEKEK